MGADHSYYVKTNATHAHAFLTLIGNMAISKNFKNLEKNSPEVVEDGGEDELEPETGDEAEAAVGVLRPNLPMRFIPLDMRLVKPSFNSRPLNSPASEFGCGSDPEDLEDDLKGDFNSRGGGSNKYLGGQTVLKGRFYSESTTPFVISPNRRTKIFS